MFAISSSVISFSGSASSKCVFESCERRFILSPTTFTTLEKSLFLASFILPYFICTYEGSSLLNLRQLSVKAYEFTLCPHLILTSESFSIMSEFPRPSIAISSLSGSVPLLSGSKLGAVSGADIIFPFNRLCAE